jgi:hypothetical protein
MQRILTAALVLAVLGGDAAAGAGKAKTAGPYNKAVAAYCKRMLDKKVGSGECTHLVTEALRLAGAEFAYTKVADNPGAGDYVWGTLVKRLSASDSEVVDSNPKSECQVGDVVQYRDVVFKNGVQHPHHTAVIAAVEKGYPTAVYEQNVGAPAKRIVLKTDVDYRTLTAGWVRIYRPARPKPDRRRPVEFTLLNRTDEEVSFQMYGKTESLPAYDSPGGHIIGRGSPTRLVVGGTAHVIQHRKGYEFYKMRNGKVGLREVK